MNISKIKCNYNYLAIFLLLNFNFIRVFINKAEIF